MSGLDQLTDKLLVRRLIEPMLMGALRTRMAVLVLVLIGPALPLPSVNE